jgi:hypothetical protein
MGWVLIFNCQQERGQKLLNRKIGFEETLSINITAVAQSQSLLSGNCVSHLNPRVFEDEFFLGVTITGQKRITLTLEMAANPAARSITVIGKFLPACLAYHVQTLHLRA